MMKKHFSHKLVSAFLIFTMLFLVACSSNNTDSNVSTETSSQDSDSSVTQNGLLETDDFSSTAAAEFGNFKMQLPVNWTANVKDDQTVFYTLPDPLTQILFVTFDTKTGKIVDDDFISGFIDYWIEDASTSSTYDSFKMLQEPYKISHPNFDSAYVFRFSFLAKANAPNTVLAFVGGKDKEYVFSFCLSTEHSKYSYDSDYFKFVNSLEYVPSESDESIVATDDSSKPTAQESSASSSNTTEDIPKEYYSALTRAKKYDSTLHMSKAALYDQLTSEYGAGFSAEAAQYAVDTITIDWKENALISATRYLKHTPFSKAALFRQLTSEYGAQFTEEEAQYAIDHVEADWKQCALDAAISYQEKLNMSPSEVYNQLVSDYGGQYTVEEAEYAIANLPQ